MATFKEQVQGLTGLTISSSGSSPTNDQLTQFLKNGVVEVINRISSLKPGELVKFTSTTNDDSDDGITLTGKILSVVREHDSTSILRSCSLIPTNDRYEAKNIDSLKYRSKYNPGYFILDKKIYSAPASAGSSNDISVTQVHYDQTVAHGSDDMQNYPTEYIYLVPLYASCQSLLSAMGSKASSLPNINMEIISTPAIPSLPDNSVTFNESPPVYTGPTTILDYADANNWINVEEDSEMSASRMQVISTQLQEFTSNMQNELNKFNEKNNEYQVELQKSIQNAQLSSQDDALVLQQYQAELQEYQAKVGKEAQKIQLELGNLNTDYQWLQGRYTVLKQEYDGAFALLAPPQQAQEQRR